jgi:hypothetical protein
MIVGLVVVALVALLWLASLASLVVALTHLKPGVSSFEFLCRGLLFGREDLSPKGWRLIHFSWIMAASAAALLAIALALGAIR